MSAPSDQELVDRALRGEQQAYRALVTRYERAVYNLLVRMLRDPALAEDLAQDTFVRAFSHLTAFDSRYKFSNWLLRIAHNAAIDAIRRRGPTLLPLEGDEGGASPVETIAAPRGEDGLLRVERQDLGRALEAAMARLRPEYRRVLVLRYQEDLGYDEIVQITGLPLGTVKSFLHRARAELARLMTAAGWRDASGGAG
jgi:RNA polymerase sigma-70 factor (ECF subfamily)